ncbi:MAG: hypothetical protein WCJ17_00555 [bacterium]
MNRVRFGFLVSLCVVSQLASASPTTEQYACMPGSVLAKDTQLQNLAFKVFEELEASGTEYGHIAYKLHNLIDWMALKGGRPPKNFKQKCLQFKKELALVPLEEDIQASIMQLIDKASRKRVGLSASAKWGIGLGSAAAFMALAAVAARVQVWRLNFGPNGSLFGPEDAAFEPCAIELGVIPTQPVAPIVAPGAQSAQHVITAPPLPPAENMHGNGAASGVGGGNDDVYFLSRATGSLTAFNHQLAQILAAPVLDESMEDTRKQLHSLCHVAMHAGMHLGSSINCAFDLSEKNRDAILKQIDIAKALSQEMRTIILNYTFRYIINNSAYNTIEVLYPKLHWFLSKFDFDVAQDVVCFDRNGCLAYSGSWLAFAVGAGNTGVINFLVDEKGVSVDQLEKRLFAHGAPLHRAVVDKDRRMIKLLLAKGARSDIPIGGGDTVDQLVQADQDEKFKQWFQEQCRMRDNWSALRKGWMGTVMRAANSRASSTRPDGFPQCGPVGSVQAAERAAEMQRRVAQFSGRPLSAAALEALDGSDAITND